MTEQEQEQLLRYLETPVYDLSLVQLHHFSTLLDKQAQEIEQQLKELKR